MRLRARQAARSKGRFAPTKLGGHAREHPPLEWFQAGVLSMWMPVS